MWPCFPSVINLLWTVFFCIFEMLNDEEEDDVEDE